MGNVVYRHCKMAIESELKKEKNSMRVIAEYDASEPGSGLKRIFYTVALNGTTDTDETLCVDVDIMVSEECRVIYAMQNEDGSTVYGAESTYPDYEYDEAAAKALAVREYEKKYGKISWGKMDTQY